MKQYHKSASRPEIPQNFRLAQRFFLRVEKPSWFFNAPALMRRILFAHS